MRGLGPRESFFPSGCPCRILPSMFELALPARTPLPQPSFLPTTRAEMDALGWDSLDVLLVTGDAYVDHPSFGVPLLGRWLVAHGYRVGVVAQPRWKNDEEALSDMNRMGRPRLFAGVSAGALDSMLAHYTAFRKKRHDDAYTPGGLAGMRPNRAVIVYAGIVRKAFPGLPLLAGGIEASLRRITHYDFWADGLRKSILFDAKLDILSCGMGERALLEVARRLDAVADIVGDLSLMEPGPGGELWPDLWADIPGTARLVRSASLPEPAARTRDEDTLVWLPSHDEMVATPRLFLEGSIRLERESHQMRRALAQPCGDRTILLTPPAAPLSTEELDSLYALPFSRRPHPSYKERIPAVEMIATSITTHRGCGGGCSFCSLALHQGRRIASRSEASILDEAGRIAAMPRGGSISDVGGPSANMWGATCRLNPAQCRRDSCMYPTICKGFQVDQRACIDLLRAVQATPGVRHVRVASGVRFDLALKDATALDAYAGEFTGGQLKIAPEHCVPEVLDLMRKPGMKPFEAFLSAFERYSKEHGKEQYVIPYLMSAFPGCTDKHMQQLGDWLAARNWSPRQVQCFIPTPGTVATAMYYAGCAPDGAPLYVARSDEERRRQHTILTGTGRPAGGRPSGKRSEGERRGRPDWNERKREGQRADNAADRRTPEKAPTRKPARQSESPSWQMDIDTDPPVFGRDRLRRRKP